MRDKVTKHKLGIFCGVVASILNCRGIGQGSIP